MNLPLERIECEALNPSTLEKKYAKYLKDFTKKEFENEFLEILRSERREILEIY